MLDVLVFAPHPDDAELGSGGAIVKAVTMGLKVGIIDFTAGELGTLGNKKIRLEEAQTAKEILGVEFRENLELPDGSLSFENQKEITFLVANKIRQYQPKIILAPYWEDRHPDHNACSKIATQATHFAKLEKVILKHSKHKIERIIYYELNGQFKPTFIMDVSDSFEKKKKAIMSFKSQFKSFTKEFLPFPLVERCLYYGSLINTKYGEAYFMKKPLDLHDWQILI